MIASEGTPPRTRKRLSSERIAQLLDVATDIFLEKGFAATSTTEIADRASASKSTFYRRYPTKERLFTAVIERHTNLVFERLGPFPSDASLHEDLLVFAQHFLRIIMGARHTALVRLVVAEAGRQPDLAQHFYRSGALRAEGMLARYLAGHVRAKRLAGTDAPAMARHFMSLITGGPVRSIVLGFEPAPMSTRALRTHLEGCLHLFLRGYEANTSEE